MKARKFKILTALLLAFILAATPASLFASVWEEEGQDFRVQLVELLSETHAEWVIEDLETLRYYEILSDEDFFALLDMGVEAALEHYLTPQQLDVFWPLSASDRFWFLFDELLSLNVWMDWDDWDWDDDWDLAPSFSGIWFDVGQALRAQLEGLLGQQYAMWIAEDLDWNREFLGDEIFFGLLTLNLADFLAEHMTEDEIESWQAQEDKWDIYWDFWNLLRKVYFPDWEDWSDWDNWERELSPIWENEGLALMTQMIEIIGEWDAQWIASELDWYLEAGWIEESTWAEILLLDIEAALEVVFEEYEFWRDWDLNHWDLWDYIIEPMIWDGLGNEPVSRDEIAAVLDAVAAEHLALYNFDIVSLIAEADMEMADLISMLYFIIEMDSVWRWQRDEDWLYDYIDDTLWALYTLEAEELMFLRMYAVIGLIYEILGYDTAESLFMLNIFDDISLAFNEDTLAEAFFLNPDMEAILMTFVEDEIDLLALLDFRLHDALGEIFNGDDDSVWPDGFAALDALLNGLLFSNMDVLYELYTEGPPIEPINWWRHVEHWDYLILEGADIEERMTFDITTGSEFAIDFYSISDAQAHLNLFYANHADAYTHFVIEYRDGSGFMEHILEVAPGSSATIQIDADLLDDMVWVTIANIHGSEVNGEFALRKTHQPLH